MNMSLLVRRLTEVPKVRSKVLRFSTRVSNSTDSEEPPPHYEEDIVFSLNVQTKLIAGLFYFTLRPNRFIYNLSTVMGVIFKGNHFNKPYAGESHTGAHFAS